MTPRRENLTPALRPPAARVPRAFTLIELLTVMLILAILSALSLPAARALAKSNNRAQAANLVRAYLAQARAIAIAQHRQAGVVFFEETPAYSLPVNPDRTAMQLFVEDYDQARHSPNYGNTVYIAYSYTREYLPPGIKVAALNDDVSRGVMTGDDDKSANNSRGVTRAVLFDASGAMITRNAMARPDIGTRPPGTYPRAYGQWNFNTAGSDKVHLGVSSPGIFLFDNAEYAAAAIPDGPDGDARRGPWIKQHADVVVINANTGGILQ